MKQHHHDPHCEIAVEAGIAAGSSADEQALLDAACAGDECALGLLLERHRTGLELYCYLSLGDRAQARTAFADTALAAWKERAEGEAATSARMWLYRLAVRVCSEAHLGSCDEFRVRESFERLISDERTDSD